MSTKKIVCGQRPMNYLSCCSWCSCSFPIVSFPLQKTFKRKKFSPLGNQNFPIKHSTYWATATLLHLLWKIIYITKEVQKPRRRPCATLVYNSVTCPLAFEFLILSLFFVEGLTLTRTRDCSDHFVSYFAKLGLFFNWRRKRNRHEGILCSFGA